MKWPPPLFCRITWIASTSMDQTQPGTPVVELQHPDGEESLSPRSVRWRMKHVVLIVLAILLTIAAVEYFTIPSYATIEALARVNPRSSAMMEERKQEHDGRWAITRKWVPLSEISPDLVHAVVVSEDGSFFTHSGFDWYEVKESVERNWSEGRIVRGASTITQQLAKNLFLSSSRDPMRKLKELVITMRMEKALSKYRILELYLNVIEWGRGVFGVEAASQTYFHKSAKDLTREEAARLAAVIPSPLRHDPTLDSRYVTNRAESILVRMEARGW